jgi:hypothetical protein
LNHGGFTTVNKKLRAFALILVMTGVWVLPVSFTTAFETPEKVKSGPVANGVLKTGESFTVTPKFYALNPCEKHKFTAVVKDAKGRVVSKTDVFWVSTNPDVAYIDDQGFAVAINPGSTIIRPVIGQAHGEPASLFVRDNGVTAGCYKALDTMTSLIDY